MIGQVSPERQVQAFAANLTPAATDLRGKGAKRRRLSSLLCAVVISGTLAGLGTLAATRDARADFGTSCTITLLAVQQFSVGGVYVGAASTSTQLCAEINYQGPFPSALPASYASAVLTLANPAGNPVIDTRSDACQTDPGYRRLAGGTVATSTFFIDMATPPGQVELCLLAGAAAGRVMLNDSPTTPPQVSVTPVTSSQQVVAPAWPTTGPSSTCGATPGLYVATLSGQLWMTTSVGPNVVCLRYQGVVTVGGYLYVPYLLGVPPATCTTNLVTLTNPISFSLATSTPGTFPEYVCYALPSGAVGVIGVQNPSVLTGATWFKDPDSVV